MPLLTVRLSDEEMAEIKRRAEAAGHKSVSAWIRALTLGDARMGVLVLEEGPLDVGVESYEQIQERVGRDAPPAASPAREVTPRPKKGWKP